MTPSMPNKKSALSLSAVKHLLAGLTIATVSCGAAMASAEWPQTPITFITPFSPGGGGDTLTRLYAQQMNLALNVPIIVENRPGAGGNIGTAMAAKAAPDGQTIVFGTTGTMGTNHFLYKRTGYALNDFDPVALFGTVGLVMVVSKDSPYKTVADLIAYGKSNPGKLSCASGGNGTISHLACALLRQKAGIELEHIPYKGTSQAVIDVMSQRVSFFIDVAPPLTPHIKEGAVRALAVTTKERLPGFPNVPTLASSGLPGYEMFSWDGVFAPKGTPAARLDRLHSAVQKVLTTPEFRQAMLARGTVVQPMSRKDFAALTQSEYARMGGVVKDIGVTLD